MRCGGARAPASCSCTHAAPARPPPPSPLFRLHCLHREWVASSVLFWARLLATVAAAAVDPQQTSPREPSLCALILPSWTPHVTLKCSALIHPALACPCPGRLAPQLLELTGRGAWRSEVPSELVTLVLAGWKVPCCHRETQSPWALRGGMGSVHKALGGRAACPLASALWCRCSSLHRALQDTPSSGPGACPWLGLSQDGPFRACSGLPGRELGRSRPCWQ